MIKGIHHVAFKCETQEQFDEMIYFGLTSNLVTLL